MHCLFPLMVTININESEAVVIVVYRDVYGVDRWQQGTSKHHSRKCSGQDEKAKLGENYTVLKGKAENCRKTLCL